MFNLDLTDIAFRKFAKRVQQQTRSNITRKNLKASGKLRNEIKFYSKRNQNSIELIYERPNYADFQDEGVSGKEVKYNTQFSYKQKRPPVKVFEKWAKQKGIKPRDKKGKFISFKSFGFIVSNAVFLRGHKPKEFF